LKNDRVILVALMAAVVAVNALCGIRMRRLSLQRMEIKEDYSQANSLQYGILSADLWKDVIQKIVTDRITDFQFTREQESALKQQISNVLEALIAGADKITQRPQTTLSGSIRGFFTKSVINMVRENVPKFTQVVADELQKPVNLDKLKAMAISQFNEYAGLTHGDSADAKSLNSLLAKYGAGSVEEFDALTETKALELEAKSYVCACVILGSVFLFMGAWWFLRKRNDLHPALFSGSTAFALVLLIASLMTPMIEIDARINRVELSLVGERIEFSDQVLYFRSKSLLQMVQILMETGEADSVVVGALILLFSILFPVCKLISAEMYLLGGEGIKRNRLIGFLAFRSGKWSMADVTAVAIFMAYIGFSGILDNQLQNLNMKTASLESIATNATSLQPGFVLFTTFVLFGLALSEILKRIAPREADGAPQAGLAEAVKS
jgi:hypothetical protein